MNQEKIWHHGMLLLEKYGLFSQSDFFGDDNKSIFLSIGKCVFLCEINIGSKLKLIIIMKVMEQI